MLPNSNYIILPWLATSGGPNAGSDVDNRVKLVEVYMPSPITVSSLIFRSGSSFLGEFWGFGMYDLDGNLVLDTGPIAQTNGFGVVSVAAITPAVTLGSKMYWLAYTCTAAMCSLLVAATPSVVTNLICDGTSIVAHATNSSVGGQLPATTGVIILDAAPGTSMCPLVKLQA